MILRLEGVPQLHDEGMLAHTAHHIALSDCVLLEILLLDLFLTKHFHREQFLVLFSLN